MFTSVPWLSALAYLAAGPAIGFVVWLVRRILKRNRGVLADAAYWVFSRFLRRSLQLYLNARHYHRVTLDSKNSSQLRVPGSAGIVLKTDDSFVALSLEQGLASSKPYTHSNLWEAGNRLRIIGDPGSGKSTLVKRLLRDECRRGMSSPRRARLPVVVNLKDFTPPDSATSEEQLADWAIADLTARVAKVSGYRMEQLFGSFAENTGVLVLLDGLDEVSTTSYERTVAAVNATANRLTELGRENIVVVTMRKNFYEQTRTDLDATLPQVLTVKPFSTNDIYEFITRWPFEPKVHAARVNKVYSELSDRPNLRDMCRNPLVLAMYVANYEAVGAEELPDTRTEFYAKVAKELLVWRRSRQSGSRIARNTLERQREQVLGSLALRNLLDRERPVNSIQRADTLETVKRILHLKSDAEAEAVFDEIAKETGITEEEKSDESFRFIHLTFCEYLAAVECVKGQTDGHLNLLRMHRQLSASDLPHERTRLVEVIPFACALVTNRSAQLQALSEVAALGDWELFGRCLLETQAYDHPDWPTYEREEGKYLQNVPHDQWNEEWLSRVHLFRTVLADATACSSFAGNLRGPNKSFSAFFSELVGLNRSRLLTLLEGFASRDSSAALRLAEESNLDLLREKPDLLVKSCVSPPFLALALDRLKSAADKDPWTIVLAEASLRFSVVAKELESHRIAGYFPATDPTNESWFTDGPATVRNECVRRAYGAPADGLKLMPFLGLLALLGRRPYARGYGVSAVVGAALFLIGIAGGVFRSGDLLFFPVAATGGALITGLAFLRDHRTILRARLLNLREDTVVEESETQGRAVVPRILRSVGSHGLISRFTMLYIRPPMLVSSAFHAIRAGQVDIDSVEWESRITEGTLIMQTTPSSEDNRGATLRAETLYSYRLYVNEGKAGHTWGFGGRFEIS